MRLALLGCAVWAAACSTETGVLIEVSQAEQDATIDHLVVYVGQDSLERVDNYFADSEPEEDIDVSGRDLVADPYRLMLRPGENDTDLMVVVLGYAGSDVVAFGALDQPVPFVAGKITQWSIVLRSGLPDGFNIQDSGCLQFIDDGGQFVKIGRPGDLDCDGWSATDDCNDLAPDINPGSTDVCGNAIDEDCDDAIDENVDDDQDMVTTCDGDCNDQNPKVFPGAPEVCDGHDNDCNQLCDDGMDGDGDRYTVCGSYLKDDGSCEVDDSITDCDDENPSVHPWADEICDGVDNDCNGACEDDSSLDRDGDGFTPCGSFVGLCGLSAAYVDCAPEDGATHPAAVELCNGEDDNCDGELLTSERCFVTDVEDGSCYLGVRACNEDTGVLAGCQSTQGDPNQAPADACTDFAICEEADDPARYQCTLEDLEGSDIGCAVNIRVTDGAQCAGNEVLLPAGNLELCTWRIVGTGDTNGEYVVGLRPLGQAVVPTRFVDTCDAVLLVDPVGATPAPETLILIRTSEPNGEETLLFHLESQFTQACAPPVGLVCDGLSAVVDDI